MIVFFLASEEFAAETKNPIKIKTFLMISAK